jgi:hypothetical protein
VRYIAHEFAHPETLDRARRWLVQAGFDPSRIEAHTHGIPRLGIAVEPGEAVEVALLSMPPRRAIPTASPASWSLPGNNTSILERRSPMIRLPGRPDRPRSSSPGGRLIRI